jgi:hypothetical protein
MKKRRPPTRHARKGIFARFKLRPMSLTLALMLYTGEVRCDEENEEKI